jgi:septum formation protein
MKIILGSSSKSRRRILEEYGYTFEVMSPNINEDSIRTQDHHELPLILARAKSEALLKRILEPSLVITADQVTVCDTDLHEKPRTEDEARLFLQKYSNGKVPATVSALVVVNTQTRKIAEGVDIVNVYFKPLPDYVIEDFIKNGEPLTKSGGFAIESPILQPYIKKVEGSIDSVMGMPLKLLKELMEKVK